MYLLIPEGIEFVGSLRLLFLIHHVYEPCLIVLMRLGRSTAEPSPEIPAPPSVLTSHTPESSAPSSRAIMWGRERICERCEKPAASASGITTGTIPKRMHAHACERERERERDMRVLDSIRERQCEIGRGVTPHCMHA
jgi:hypothetical protein